MFALFMLGCLVGLACGLLVAARSYRSLIASQSAVIVAGEKLRESQKEVIAVDKDLLAATDAVVAQQAALIANQQQRLDIYERDEAS